MKKRIGMTDGFDWSKDSTFVANMYGFFNQVQNQNEDFDFFSIDWRSIDDKGNTKAINLKSEKIEKINVEDLDLFHLLYLGKVAHEWDNLISKLEIVNSLGTEVINPLETVKYSINKQYLLDSQDDLSLVPTVSVSSNISLEELREISGDKYHILKPINGEKGNLVGKIQDLTERELSKYSSLTDRILLQPFMEGIAIGERHLIYLGDTFSHAIVKIPSKGQYKINASFKSLSLPYSPTREEINIGFDVKKKFKHPLEIYRVDLVSSEKGPKIMEIEAVNPSHHETRIGAEKIHAQRLGTFYGNYFARGSKK